MAQRRCPRCNGTGKSGMVLVHTNRPMTDADAAGLQAHVAECDLCKGFGNIEAENYFWVQIGETWRQARLSIGMGLREWAEEINAIPSTYAQMESGKLEPDPAYSPMPAVKKEIGKCREYILENEARIDTLRKPHELIELVTEARDLIIERGESTDVPLQFRQHGWLTKVNAILPGEVPK